ncbi:MAG: DUF4351 domain-containing protein [Magnetococcales bacterium]|nr:DUF4351 domain-containing protein [Magnetococcales bacterium]NGZ04873.1 DUF4351 domain-containing protein [Magnetococcales bacterium]
MLARGLSQVSIHFEHFFSGIRSVRMKGLMDDIMQEADQHGWTPESVMELGRLTWFEAMMNNIPEERLFQIPRAMEIRQEGREEEGRKIVQRLLTRRFGPLPEYVMNKIAHADAESLERWGDRLLDAGSLDEVFATDPPVVTH